MAEFTVISQRLELADPTLGPVVEELRTLQVKRPTTAVEQKRLRASWQRFGAAKGKVGAERGVTDILKEELVIEPPSAVWGTEEDDKIAHRLVSTVGKMNISSGLSRYQSAPPTTTFTSGHSRKNSDSTPGLENSTSGPRKNSTGSAASDTRSRKNSQDGSLPQPPGTE